MSRFGPAIDVKTLLRAEFSWFRICKSKWPPKTINLGDYLEDVRSGKWSDKIDAVREANLDSKADANKQKIKLPIIKPSGVFHGLKEADFETHSGLLVLDLDDVDDLKLVRKRLTAHDSVVAVHLSPRGTGLKVFVAITARCPSDHNDCWSQILEDFGFFLPQSAAIDPAPSNISSNCFVSWDPDLWIATSPRTPFLPITSTPVSGPRREENNDTISEASMGGKHSMGGIGGKSGVTPTVFSAEAELLRSQKRKRRQARAKITQLNPVLRRIYRQYFANRSVAKGQRNAFLISLFPGLYCVVGEEVFVELFKLHHQQQTGIWTTGIRDHMIQVNSMTESWGLKYEERLADLERVRYDDLGQRMRAAFRIMRDLCGRAEGAFMSQRELGFRLGVDPSTAGDYLSELQAIGAIDIETAGEKWTPGRKPRATEYRWTGTESFKELLL